MNVDDGAALFLLELAELAELAVERVERGGATARSTPTNMMTNPSTPTIGWRTITPATRVAMPATAMRTPIARTV